MNTDERLVELLAEIRRLTRDPYPWQKVRALLPLLILRLLTTAAYVLSFFDLLPVTYGSLEFFLNIGVLICLLVLSGAHNQYRIAAVPMLLYLVLMVVFYRVGQPPILMLMATLLSLASNCLEYIGHAKLTMRQDKALTRRWNKLFFGNIAAMLGGGGLFYLVAILSYVVENAELSMYLLTMIVTYLPDLIVDVLYLYFLGRTIRLIKSQKILF